MLKAGDMRVAATTHAQKQVSAASAATKPFRRGFLDSKPQQQQVRCHTHRGQRQQLCRLWLHVAPPILPSHVSWTVYFWTAAQETG